MVSSPTGKNTREDTMKFELGDIRAFVSVARLGSFTSAAAEMNLSQSALSRRIEKIESALGTQLFLRTTRKVSLTAFGVEFNRRSIDILHKFEEAMFGMNEATRRLGGEVTLSCMPSAVRFFLPPVLKSYRSQYPGATVNVREQGATEASIAVKRGEVDFAFNQLENPDPALAFTEILQERLVLACYKSHPLARSPRVRWADLGGQDYMIVSKSSQNRLLMEQNVLNGPRAYCEARHVSTLVSLVEVGVGVAAVPSIAMPVEEHPLLVSVPLVDPIVSRTIGLITRAGQKMSPTAQSLVDEFLAVKRHS
ncbi:LysR family transcriptional regulator [Aquamicrobium ahrensii]|uniref:DNA-binding transcriptional LysR family regulator n=1 Tax=Aquamicrobium ahrensii TaxID=469551 RepID=A0ABV2KSD8_9HYPH